MEQVNDLEGHSTSSELLLSDMLPTGLYVSILHCSWDTTTFTV